MPEGMGPGPEEEAKPRPAIEAAPKRLELTELGSMPEQLVRDREAAEFEVITAKRKVDTVKDMTRLVNVETYPGDLRAKPPALPEAPQLGIPAGEPPEPPRASDEADEEALEVWIGQMDSWKDSDRAKAPDPPALTTAAETAKFKHWKTQMEQWKQAAQAEAQKQQQWFDEVNEWLQSDQTEAPAPLAVETEADRDKLELWLRELEQWKRDYADWDRANVRRPQEMNAGRMEAANLTTVDAVAGARQAIDANIQAAREFADAHAGALQTQAAAEMKAAPTAGEAQPAPTAATGAPEPAETRRPDYDATRSDERDRTDEDDRTRELVSRR